MEKNVYIVGKGEGVMWDFERNCGKIILRIIVLGYRKKEAKDDGSVKETFSGEQLLNIASLQQDAKAT